MIVRSKIAAASFDRASGAIAG